MPLSIFFPVGAREIGVFVRRSSHEGGQYGPQLALMNSLPGVLRPLLAVVPRGLHWALGAAWRRRGVALSILCGGREEGGREG